MTLRFRLSLLAVCLCLALGLAAQTADTATIRGQVLDPSHAAVPGATVTVTNAQTGAVRTATTDAHGQYLLAGLPVAGAYTLAANKSGLATQTVPNLNLTAGASASIDLTLGLQGNATAVTVTGVAGAVRTDQPQLGERLSAQQIAEVPLPGNQITNLPLLNSANRPSINMGDVFMNQTLITTNGAGRRQADFVVDGVNSNDDWGHQTIFTAVPAPAVEEMTVLENGFSAQYGVGSGGVVNMVTKSGGDQYHGMAEYSGRPNGLQAALSGYNSVATSSGGTLSGNDLTGDELNQGDVSFSGPLNKATQFSLTAEGTTRHRVSPVTSPVDPVNYLGIYDDGEFLGRLDHRLSAGHSVFARLNFDRFHDTNPNGIVGGNSLPSVARVFSRRTYEGVLGDEYTVNSNLVNSARLQFQLADPITAFAPVNNAIAFSVPIAGLQTFTSGTSTSALLINRQYEIGDTLSGDWGRHDVQFGDDAIIGRDGGNSKEFGGPNYLGTFSFPTCSQAGDTTAQLLAYCESSSYINISNATGFTQSFGTTNYRVNDDFLTGFVQDDFHLRRNLTVNLGVSYMRQTFTQSGENWSPRLGFDYSPMANTVVRGSFSILYSPVVDNEDASYVLSGPTGVANYSFSKSAGSSGSCFPSSLTGYAAPPACASAPGAQSRSLYLQPGMAAYYNQFFPVAALDPGYQVGLYNPYTEQWTLGVERSLNGHWDVSADYVGSHTVGLIQPVDLNAPAPLFRTVQNQWRGVTNNPDGSLTCNKTGQINLTASQAATCATNAANAARPLGTASIYGTVQSDLNEGWAWYDALEVNVSHPLSQHIQTQISYTWSRTLDTVDQDATAQNPNNALAWGSIEKGPALWDQPQRLVVSGVYQAPGKINFGGIVTAASGVAYNITTGTANDGVSADTSRPVVNGVTIGRNTGRGNAINSVDPFIERPFHLGEHANLLLRAESFDVFNHANFVSYLGTYGNGAAPATLGLPSLGATAQLLPRQIQFEAKISF